MKAIIVILGYMTHFYAHGVEINLSSYLGQVRNEHEGLKSLESKRKASSYEESNADLVYSTTLNSRLSYLMDKRGTSANPLGGNESSTSSGTIGLNRATAFGSNINLSYNVSKTKIIGGNSSLITSSDYFENSLALELTQSLYRNAFGSEISARENSLRFASRASELQSKYDIQLILSEAENTFYQLAFAVESMKVQQASLKRSQKIVRLNRSRYNKKLVDKVDYLQALAALKVRELDSEIAKEVVRSLSMQFNALRGVVSDVVSEEISNDVILLIEKNTFIKSGDSRLDLEAFKLNTQSSIEMNKLSLESLKPDVSLFLNTSLFGVNSTFPESTKESFGTSRPVYSVGINFSMPLDFLDTRRARTSEEMKILASELQIKRREFETSVNYNNLLKVYSEQRKQLKTYDQLVKVQQDKLVNEEKRQKRGNSTTFQVLSFEQEFLSSQLRRLQHQSDLVKTYIELKLYK